MNPLLERTANGKDWQKASLLQKTEFCDIQSKRFTNPSNAAQTLLVELDAFYGTDAPGTDVKLSEAIGLIVGAAQSLLPTSEPPSDK